MPVSLGCVPEGPAVHSYVLDRIGEKTSVGQKARRGRSRLFCSYLCGRQEGQHEEDGSECEHVGGPALSPASGSPAFRSSESEISPSSSSPSGSDELIPPLSASLSHPKGTAHSTTGQSSSMALCNGDSKLEISGTEQNGSCEGAVVILDAGAQYGKAIANEQKKMYGTQFHPEVDLTERGMEMLRNFLFEIAVVNAAHTFYNGTTTLPISEEDRTPRKRISKTLNMTTNPEEKRKIIGDTFVKVANEVIGEMNLKPEEVLLAQGTLRPDLIESASLLASNKAEVIKTHHNDTELIRKLRDEVDVHIGDIASVF
ncbi:unnamed protein product [Lampetra planeri]